jgi:nucleoside-diphosphate-sugar epimerase
LHVVPGGGDSRVSLVHVADLVEGLLLVAETGERLSPDGPPGQGHYYMTTDDQPTYAELGQAIATAAGKPNLTVLHMPRLLLRLIGCCGDALGRIRQRPTWLNSDKIAEAMAGTWTCSSTKARTTLGWSPAAALPDRLRETVLWYRQAGTL